jgi:hypothetical protein
VKVTRLTAETYDHLATFGRTDHPDPWVREVEEFLYADVPAQRGGADGSSALVVMDGSLLVAAAAHGPHATFSAEHILAFVLRADARGKGLGEGVFRVVVDHVLRSTSEAFVMWHVHERNLPMITISNRIGEAQGRDREFFVYAHP